MILFILIKLIVSCFKITDYENQEITSMITELNRGFKVDDHECTSQSIITFNNIDTTNNEDGFMEIGSYSINNGENTREITIKQTGNIPTHIIIMSTATLPILLDIVNVFATNEIVLPIYVYQDRSNTINIQNLGSFATLVEFIDGGINQNNYPENVCLQIYRTNPNTHVHLYIDDLRWHNDFVLLRNKGIPFENYHVTVSSDGTHTYLDIPRDFDSMPDPISEWNKQKAEYIRLKNLASKGKFLDGITISLYNEIKTAPAIPYIKLKFFISTEINHEFHLVHKNALKSSVAQIQNEIDLINFANLNPYNQIMTLKEESNPMYLNFLKSLNCDPDEIVATYFPSSNEKPFFIYIGTNPVYNTFGTVERFRFSIDEMIRWIGNSYTIVYKGHPSDDGSITRPIMESRKIKMMPPRIPIEVVLWSLPNIKIGGSESSVFMSSLPSQTLFIYGSSPSALVEPLKTLHLEGSLFFQVVGTNFNANQSVILTNDQNKRNMILVGILPAVGVLLIAIVVIIIILKCRKPTVQANSPLTSSSQNEILNTD